MINRAQDEEDFEDIEQNNRSVGYILDQSNANLNQSMSNTLRGVTTGRHLF